MPSQPALTVVSASVRGRVRVRLEGLRGHPHLAQAVRDRLEGYEGIREVRTSTVTGTVLVLFDAGRLTPRRLTAELLRCRDGAGRTRDPDKPAAGGAAREPWHAVPAHGVLARLATATETGLTGAEAQTRLARTGPNRFPTPEPRSSLAMLVDQVATLPVALLVGAAGLSLASAAPFEALVILGVVATNALVGYATESRVERILGSLQRMRDPVARVRRDGREQTVPAASLVPGDVLVLKAGHDVPADGRLVEVTDGLMVNESALTGESLPVSKQPAALHAESTLLADRTNMVYAGTVVSEGAGRAAVTETGRRTEFGRIRALVAETTLPPTPLEGQLERMGRTLVGVTLALSGAALALGLLRGVGLAEMVRTAIALGVAAVPEGLPAVATVTLALGTQRMLRRNALVRRLEVVESLGSTTVVCVDKTGTVTENRMAVQAWALGEGTLLSRDAAAGSPNGLEPHLARALLVSVLCNEAELAAPEDGGAIQGSGTEGALLEAARALGADYRALRRDHPLRVTHARHTGQNWMATVHDNGGGRSLIAVKGAPEEVLTLASHVLGPRGEPMPLTPARRRHILAANARMAADALRVLGLAYREGPPATAPPAYDGLVWAGLVGMADPIRSGVRETIEACRHAGVRVIMVTGDQSATAIAVGRALGLGREGELRVAEASQLAHLPPEALRGLARQVDIFARVSPEHKYQIVRALQASGEVVAMTGDGINDAPALRAADIGVAMGARGTELARDLADVVLLDDDFGSIVGAVEQGRTIQANVRKAVHFLLATNLSEVLLTVGAIALGMTRPLTAVQLLWMNLLSDVLPALALAVEPPEPGVMGRPPRAADAAILSGESLRRIGLDAALLATTTYGVTAMAAGRSGGAHGSTVAFSTLTLAQLFHALAARSVTRSAFAGLGRNPLMAAAVGGSLALQIGTVTIPPLRQLLGTTPLGLRDWGLVAAGALFPLFARELVGGRRP
jgi:Ca2+-transporting ATPase